MDMMMQNLSLQLSTSAWGSELKYWCNPGHLWNYGLPLREVVSWNFDTLDSDEQKLSLPLREVVSWNVNKVYKKDLEKLSTSAWGSELKSVWCFRNQNVQVRLPLREVVSWNKRATLQPAGRKSLPLREVVSWNCNGVGETDDPYLSTSAWGSELKCPYCNWILCSPQSTSAWGSELKYK